MNFKIHFNELCQIFSEELPKKQQLSNEIIRKILFHSVYKIIYNINFIKCFNEFNNYKLYTFDNKEIALDYTNEINAKTAFINKGKYQNCKKINKLILLRIFNFRKNNDITYNIFKIKLKYNSLYNHEKILLINHKSNICNRRLHYLLKFGIKISLLNEFIIYRMPIYSINYLNKKISDELNISNNKLAHLYRIDLIKYYLKHY